MFSLLITTSVIKIIIQVAILIQSTKHTLNSLSLVKGDPQNKKNEFKYEHFPHI